LAEACDKITQDRVEQGKMSDGADKRTAKRVAYPCEVKCLGQGAGVLSARLSDLSATGAFIDSVTELPAGMQVTLKFALPTGPLTINAEVMHSMPHFGMGVRFVDVTPDQIMALERVIHELG
jgi:hypothetical protein